MPNPYFTASGNPVNQARGVSALVRYEFSLIQAAFDAVYSQAFSSALPGQAGNNGKFIKTDGTTATWAAIDWSDVANKPTTLVANGAIVTAMFAVGAKSPFAGSADTATTAGTAGIATNLAGTTQWSIPYQSASGVTSYLGPGTAGQVLLSGGAGAPIWGNSGQLAGEVCHFAMNSAPTGFLKANGAAVSRTTYAALFAAIGTTFGVGDGLTTFNVPELRGEHIRAWDDSRGIDAGRVFGSAQLDAAQDHTHAFSVYLGASGANSRMALGTNATNTLASSDVGAPQANAGGTPRTASETRPRNVALLACIKY